MANDVEITIGASIENLQASLDSAKESVNSLAEGFKGLAELAGISLSAAGVKEFITSMAELGAQAEKINATLGTTDEQFVQLAGIARLGSSDIQTMALGLERMTLNIQRSTRDATNPAAIALKQLGINAREFTSIPADQQFQKLTTAVSQFNPSMNLTNSLMLVGGRGVAQLISTLRQAGTSWEDWNAAVTRASAGLAEALPKLAEADVKFQTLGLAMQSLGARLFDILSPAISRVTDGITQWVESLDASTLQAAVSSMANYTLQVVAAIGELVIQVIQLIRDLKAELVGLFGPVSEWGDKIAGKLNQINTAIQKNKFSVTQFEMSPDGTMVPKGSTESAPASAPANADAAAATDAVAQQLKQNADDAAAARVTLKAALEGVSKDLGVTAKSTAEQATDYNTSMTKLVNSFKMLKDMGPVNFGAGSAQKDAMKNAQLDFQTQMQDIKTLKETYQISQQQMVQMEKQASATRMNAEIEAGGNVVTAWKKNAAEVAKINAENAKTVMKDWKQVADQLASDFSQALDEVLTKQKTFSQAMGQMFGKMVEQMIAQLITLIAEWIILNIVSGGTVSLGSVASGMGGLIGGLANLPGHAAGTPYVANTGLAMIHQGEAIIPAENNPFTGGSGGMGGGVNFTVQALDAASFSTWLRSGGGNMLSRYLSQSWQNNPSMRPGFAT